jgi:uncharacterized protein (DUF2252 family)
VKSVLSAVPEQTAGERKAARRTNAAGGTTHASPDERAARGKALRADAPLDSHAELVLAVDRADPVDLLEEQAATRVPELVPIRYGRMNVSPFTFYRGAARLMARDLALTPRSGLTTQICGDAHLSNFGLFASPERRLVFDMNDFDETMPGPWEWDVKRLAASLAVVGRTNGYSDKQRAAIVMGAAARYRTAMAEFAAMRDLDVWYAHADMDEARERLSSGLDPKRAKTFGKILDKARTRDSMQALGKLTDIVDGQRRIKPMPPLITPLQDLVPEADFLGLKHQFHAFIRQYRQTLQSDRRSLLETFRFVDMARKVVGVGSVGTRCWIVLLVGRDDEDPLFLQVKEAVPSVLREVLGKSEYDNEGHRVVAGQRLMQEASDIFLGWQRTEGLDGVPRDFYVRQLRDWKGSIEVETFLPKGMKLFSELCAWSLARAHARSGDRIAIAGYLGSSPAFEVAIAEFAEAYADLNERDHAALSAAIKAGTVAAETGL